METVESLNLQTLSRQAFTLVRKLGCEVPISRDKTSTNENEIILHLVGTARTLNDKAHTIKVKRELKL